MRIWSEHYFNSYFSFPISTAKAQQNRKEETFRLYVVGHVHVVACFQVACDPSMRGVGACLSVCVWGGGGGERLLFYTTEQCHL